MGKEKPGFLSPKAIGNRIKAKGLQKLRWYCQMCQKQCRDENGFKCHTTSETHQRQLLLVAEDTDQFIDTFSKEFADNFVELLSRRFGTKRVSANNIYQEYISDRDHLHMNSTQWETLTDFVKWLGREGHCNVDHTEKGWFITWIDRDPETIRRQEQLAAKRKMDMDDEERMSRFIQKQVERVQEQKKHSAEEEVEHTELKRQSEEEKVVFKLPASLSGGGKPREPTDEPSLPPENPLTSTRQKPLTAESSGKARSKPKEAAAAQKRKSALDEIMEFEEQSKEKMNRKSYWLTEGIVVKIITRKLGEKYYKKKAVVREVVEQFGAVVKMLDTDHKLKVDQTHLETVIPAHGKAVRIVNGAYRGCDAVLLELDEKNFCCKVRVERGPVKGRVIDRVAYEDLSKVAVPT
ncbi:PREDICTED: DNA/RNA-binding protein KIN17-like [Priapulus caudatus]|uniref:DNA/RNA-binding protein KIN17-like n=1 Tax=Priapulus caudatus TaxID=37621 RepID=A0ABM1EKR4_PRICU|nr:PREDICTED: DNA/RNA-binding protein KIN17-like [Priapulus caudatus]XP_014672783.1 PREDICTED: DNA/RNA-binding protein KIN17-like [Priapulus caudatus]XP_014672784.1 PREDICTED: DNA/RNA-binding protein KIN17-like [Priapulus caudatus]XP_014672785.1 PREDICTED: DNA/RNA-binding protein KIN17-like [Priapulus caudatus]